MKDSLSIHCIAIGGTGMAPLACLLQELGHQVRGSDNPLYPPMSTLLEAAGITPMVGYDPEHLEPRPDLVVIGNAVPRDNPEARATEEREIEFLSMPQTLWRFFLEPRRRVVMAGTHGKTTTTSMGAWVFTDCDRDPSYLIGGLPKNLPASFHLGDGELFVIEGDEYNAAYFDRGPKFLHYRPDTLILTSAEYDHADLYPSHEALLDAYGQLVAGLPEDGLLVAYGADDDVRRLAERAPCRVVFYGTEPGATELGPVEPLELSEDGTRMVIDDLDLSDLSSGGSPSAGRVEIRLQVPGRHNAANALAVYAAARREGIDGARAAAALGRFEGVARRLEELGTAAGVTVIDDFAHHPTAVGESLAALQKRFPDRRVVACFEPRSLTAGRRFLEEIYFDAFRRADQVMIAPFHYAERIDTDDQANFAVIASRLREAGTPAIATSSLDDLFERVVGGAQPGDVLVTMSSGSFERMPHRLLAAMEQRDDRQAREEREAAGQD